MSHKNTHDLPEIIRIAYDDIHSHSPQSLKRTYRQLMRGLAKNVNTRESYFLIRDKHDPVLYTYDQS